ncbi:uncharacterized protein K441DRAFT_549805, partial [Cenococcum geophilum 1.58]|uniref:uncharacterized protein n=1 Tax=Cenococcum geophilum 1.58 TaxID=794803 RepID=UPI00358E71D1
GKYKAAEEINRRALKGREKVVGQEYLGTLTSVSNLAIGKYKAAKEINRRALEGYKKALNKEHPSILTSIYYLAFLFY